MRNKYFIVGVASAALMMSNTAAAEAAMITLGGVDYDVATINGTFVDNQTLLEQQPWYVGPGNTTSLGQDAATQVGGSLGFGNQGGFSGPFFGVSFDGSFVRGSFPFFFGGTTGPNAIIAAAAENAVWAVATPSPVPEASTLIGSLAVLSLGYIFKRKQANATLRMTVKEL